MRGIETNVVDLRKTVYTEIAKLSYEYDGDMTALKKRVSHIPYEIIPGEVANYRDDVFLERAIIRERMRLAMGLPLRTATEMAPTTDGLEDAVKPEKYYQPPLIDIIKFACHSCPDNVVAVTDQCQGCLARPCTVVCPKKAVSIKNRRSNIDQDLCIKCGKCIEACPYGAIHRMQRPCASACGMKAISSDEFGRADIDQSKCVSCGMCLANCPFGAISDKAQIFQLIQAIKSGTPVYAAVAPAIAGQFGPELKTTQTRSAFKALGFEDVVEVAIGADLCTIMEAKDFLEEVPEKLPFMATSCCPAWSVMAKKLFPQQANSISMALTPMVLTGRLIKKKHPGCKVAFIGPCAAKKLEASRRTIRSDIDFVLTFEELMGLFEAKDIKFKDLPEDDELHGASADGRGFAVSGGVAKAVVNYIKEEYPEVGEIKVAAAQGLEDCRKLLMAAKAGKYNGYLLEGMACPGGCIAGVGTIQPIAKSKMNNEKEQRNSVNAHANASAYKDLLESLEEKDLVAPGEHSKEAKAEAEEAIESPETAAAADTGVKQVEV